MQYFPPALENLVEQFARLPGVGVKSAQRLAFHVLSLPEEDAAAFAQAKGTLKIACRYNQKDGVIRSDDYLTEYTLLHIPAHISLKQRI